MNLHQQCKPLLQVDKNAHDFFSLLVEEMIDNDIDGDGVTTRSQAGAGASVALTPSPLLGHSLLQSSDVLVGLTPCKEKGKSGKYTKQGWCKVCQTKTIVMCRMCSKVTDKPFWLCNTKTGRNCWNSHFESKHAE